ncbi:MAG: HAD family hydrolase [Terrimesophilobacter sp.]
MIGIDTARVTPQLSLVLFDLDDTLFAHREAVDLGITAHRASLDSAAFDPDDASEIRRWHELEEQHYHRYLSGEIDFLGQRRARARDFVAAYGIDVDDAGAQRWYEEYYRDYERAWALHPDTLPCLDELRRTIPGVRFGLITNGERDYQTEKVEALGLTPHIEHLVTSGEFGITKPDARIFHHACALFDVAPVRAAYIGDRLHTDAIGAADAGLTGVWLDRRGSATETELAEAAASGVIVLHSLSELLTSLTAR